MKKNRRLLCQREAIIGLKANPTRQLLEQVFYDETPESKKEEDVDVRGRAIDWPENTWGNRKPSRA